jgi:hypothetical protein
MMISRIKAQYVAGLAGGMWAFDLLAAAVSNPIPAIPLARKRLPRCHSLAACSICFPLVPRHRVVSNQLGQVVVVGAQFVGRHVFEVQK